MCRRAKGNSVAGVMIYATECLSIHTVGRRKSRNFVDASVHQPSLIRMLTESPFGYRLLYLFVRLFFAVADVEAQTKRRQPSMRQSNLIFTTCNWCQINIDNTNTRQRKRKKHAYTPKWISITHRNSTDVWIDECVDSSRLNPNIEKVSLANRIILIVTLRLAFLMQFIEWRRQINVWFCRYRI